MSRILPRANFTRKSGGFTLIEVMITAVIIGILAAVALPIYSTHVKRGAIPEAVANLAAKQNDMDKYYYDFFKYTGAQACADDTTTSKKFKFTCTLTTDPQGYVLKATGQGSMTGFVYSIDQSGTKSTVQLPSGWSYPSPNNCWATTKEGKC